MKPGFVNGTGLFYCIDIHHICPPPLDPLEGDFLL